MKSASDKSHPKAQIGDNVTIPIPDVEKSKVDLRSIIGIVMNKTSDGLYKIGAKHEILQNLYCRMDFEICGQKFITERDLNTEVEISLRSAATKHCVGSGQGFVKCSCQKNCQSNRCDSKKNSILSYSKCQQSLSCTNK